jgi:hypothetical protein
MNIFNRVNSISKGRMGNQWAPKDMKRVISEQFCTTYISTTPIESKETTLSLFKSIKRIERMNREFMPEERSTSLSVRHQRHMRIELSCSEFR